MEAVHHVQLPQWMDCTVGKRVVPQGCAQAAQDCIVCDSAEGEHYFWSLEFVSQPLLAAHLDLTDRRLVGRWKAFDGIGDSNAQRLTVL